MSCPSPEELSRALSDGAEPALEAHLATCPTCIAEWNATLDMLALAREVGAPLPSAARREEVRTTMLAASRLDALAAPRPSRTKLVAVAAVATAAALAAAIALVVVTRDDAPAAPTHAHANLRSRPGARYLAMSSAPDEVVLLEDGAVDVEVSPLHPGERFRVIVGRDEVEVHGTQFVVTARAGVLVSVEVGHGVVEVRPRDGDAQLLHAGERWAAQPPRIASQPSTTAEPTASIALPSAPPKERPARHATIREPARAVAERSPPAPRAAEPPPQERAYDDAWAAMRTSRFAEAAAAFSRVQLLDPDGPLAEDATYWYAVALARTKQAAMARTAFAAFLELYPRGKRAGEASAMLGWLLIDAKQPAEAELRFRAAIDDPNAAVRKSAQAGLDALTPAK